MVSAGEPAPTFELSDQDENTVSLADFKGRKVLVYFYPKADTPGCTTQSCGLRDVLGDIGDTAVLGISPDKPAQKRFDEKYGLGFPLLSDEDHAVAESHGAWGEKSMYGASTWASSGLCPRRRGRQPGRGVAEDQPEGHAHQAAEGATSEPALAADLTSPRGRR